MYTHDDWTDDGVFCPVCETENLLDQYDIRLSGLRILPGTGDYYRELTCEKCGATVSFEIRLTMEFKVTEYESIDGDE